VILATAAYITGKASRHVRRWE